MKYVIAFLAFWWDFIVGDSIVLAIGSVAALLGAAALAQNGYGIAAEILLPLAIVGTLAGALGRR
ncbi:MAG: hypothetical protein AB7N24_01395 [Dehalococcoidia bacterium]